MNNPSKSYGFYAPASRTAIRRAVEAFCFYAVMAMVAVAIGFVAAVLVLTAPKRTALIGSALPAVAWEIGR